MSGLDGVWITASETVLHAVLQMVDNISRYRVLSHLQQVDKSLMVKTLWGLPPRLPHLLHTVILSVLEATSESLG